MHFFENILDFLAYLDSGIGILIFVFIYIFVVILILPASWLSIAAGYLYGAYLGSVIVFLSAFLGASISFFISKQVFSKTALGIINKFPKLSLLENIIQKGGLKLIILTRLSPLFPFSILNYFYGLNNITYKDFSISLLCIIPGTFFYSSVGSLLNNLSDIKNLKLNNNFFITLMSIVSTALIIYYLSRYSNEIINESK